MDQAMLTALLLVDDTPEPFAYASTTQNKDENFTL